MTDKKKADPKASPNTRNPNNISASAQHTRLLELLHAGPEDTITARSELNVMMRDASHIIETQRITLTCEHGRPYKGVALYHLSPSEA